MKTLTSKDIEQMVSDQIFESLKVLMQKGDKKKLIISPGFKISHKQSGLNYDVTDVKIEDGKPVILARRPKDGSIFKIPSEKFKEYKGL